MQENVSLLASVVCRVVSPKGAASDEEWSDCVQQFIVISILVVHAAASVLWDFVYTYYIM